MPAGTHILQFVWASAEGFACCGKLLNISIEPRNLTRRCPSPPDSDAQLLNTWSAQYDSMLCCIDEIT